MVPVFSITYDIVTPESAEQGCCAESGFYSRGGWKHEDESSWTLREIVDEFGKHSMEDSGRWFSTTSPREDRSYFERGEHMYFNVHPPRRITAASYARVRRILEYRRNH